MTKEQDMKDAIGAIAELSLVNSGKIDAMRAVLKALVATLGKGMPQMAAVLDANIEIISRSIERPAPITPQQAAGDQAHDDALAEFRSLLATLKPH